MTKAFVKDMVSCSVGSDKQCSHVSFNLGEVKWCSASMAQYKVPLCALRSPGMVIYMRIADNTWYQCITRKIGTSDLRKYICHTYAAGQSG
jgi:hypothetical protein